MATDLNDLHLADLYERAAAAGIDGYRLLRRDQLIERLSEEDEAWAEEESSEAEAGEGPAAAEPDTEADTDEVEVEVEATVLDPEADEPVELGPRARRAGTSALRTRRPRRSGACSSSRASATASCA